MRFASGKWHWNLRNSWKHVAPRTIQACFFIRAGPSRLCVRACDTFYSSHFLILFATRLTISLRFYMYVKYASYTMSAVGTAGWTRRPKPQRCSSNCSVTSSLFLRFHYATFRAPGVNDSLCAVIGHILGFHVLLTLADQIEQPSRPFRPRIIIHLVTAVVFIRATVTVERCDYSWKKKTNKKLFR